MFSGRNWKPDGIHRIVDVLKTSTRPLHVVTNDGNAIVKYIGNPAGNDALITELVGSEIANLIGLKTPEFAVVDVPDMNAGRDPFVQVEAGPAFFSRWEEAVSLAPNSNLLSKIRKPKDVVKLVVFDTWLRNKDRFSADEFGYGFTNFDNVLFRQDARKTELLVIDHTHAIAETTLDDELDQGWVDEKKVYGLFSEFKPLLEREAVLEAISAVEGVSDDAIKEICGGVPRAWGMTDGLTDRLTECISSRAKKLRAWLLPALFDQFEMELDGKEG